MGAVASQITSSPLQSEENIKAPRHRWPVNSPHKGPVTRKKFPFDDVIMYSLGYNFLSKKPSQKWRIDDDGDNNNNRTADNTGI